MRHGLLHCQSPGSWQDKQISLVKIWLELIPMFSAWKFCPWINLLRQFLQPCSRRAIPHNNQARLLILRHGGTGTKKEIHPLTFLQPSDE